MLQTIEEQLKHADLRSNQLKSIMYLLQTNLEEMISEVDRGYALYTKVGEKTDLVKHIESMLDFPLEDNLADISEKILEQIRILVNAKVIAFFEVNKNLIAKVLVSKASQNKLYYSIALVNDNTENRFAIFDFLDRYDATKISGNCPVYFQFMPIELMGNVKNGAEITLKS